MRSSTVGRLATALCVMASLTIGVARAAGSDEEVEKLGAEGVQAYQGGRLEEARGKLQRAFTLSHYPTVGVWLARALEGLGRQAEAFDVFQSIAETPLAPGAPKVFQEAQATARTERARLSKSVALIQLSVQGEAPEKVGLKVNGEPREYPPSGVMAVAPGQSVIEVETGPKRSLQTISVTAGQSLPLVLDVRGAAPAAAAPAPAPGPVPTSTAPPATEAVQAPKATEPATLEKGFDAGARLFVGIPFGETFAESAMSDMSAPAFGLWVDANYRLNPHLSFGGYLTYAVAGAAGSSASQCDSGGYDCSHSQLRLGLQGQYYFTPEEPRSGWVGAGIGYEWMTSTVDDKANSQTVELKISGPELLLQGGYDWQLGHLRFGPTAALGLGRFTSVKLEQTVAGVTNSATPDPDDSFHGWFFLGLRATILLGG